MKKRQNNQTHQGDSLNITAEVRLYHQSCNCIEPVEIQGNGSYTTQSERYSI